MWHLSSRRRQDQEVAIGSPVQEPPGVASGVGDAAPPDGRAEARGRLSGGDGVIPPRRSSRHMDPPRSYRDKRAWQKRALLAQYLGRPVSALVHLKEGPDIEGASQELSEEQQREVSVGSDLDEKATFIRVLEFMGHVLLVAASGVDSGNGMLEEAQQLLSAMGDVVPILDTMKALVVTSDLRELARQKFDCAPDIGDAVEAALLTGATYKGRSAAGVISVSSRTVGQQLVRRSSYVLPPGVLGGGQEFLQPQATLRNSGGAGGAGSGGSSVGSDGPSQATSGSGGRGGGGDNFCSGSTVGYGGERASPRPFAFPGPYTRGHHGRRRPKQKREFGGQRSHLPLGAAGGHRSLLCLLFDTSGVPANAVSASDSGDARQGSRGGRSTLGGDGGAVTREDGV